MNNLSIIDIALSTLKEQAFFHGQFVPTLNTRNGGIAGTLHLQIPYARIPVFNVEIKGTLRHYQVLHLLDMANTHNPFMVVTEKIYPALKEELRRRKINYLDASGNLFIQEGQTLIWIEGQKTPPIKKEGTNKAFTKTGLKVVFYFLIHQERVNQPYRQIAEATGVALGNIKNILDGLNQAGFLLPINKERYKLQRKRELLERWITAYGSILRPSLFGGAYRFWNEREFDHWQQLQLDIQHSRWGGEPAADLLTNYLQPQSLLVYTTEKTKLVRLWRLLPDDKGVLRIYNKFWNDDLTDMATNLSPVLLVYADLLLTDDPRCLETADRIFDQYLKNNFE